MQYIDTHAHLSMLTHDSLANILARANDAEVSQIVTVATDESSWDLGREIASKEPTVFYTLGLHPHESDRWDTISKDFYARFSNGIPEKCVGIGEAGLDFHYNLSQKDSQMEAFEAQLAFCNKINLPIIIHCREAFDEVFSLVKKTGLGSAGGVMHCFTGDKKQALEAIDLGLKISFSGILTFKNAEGIREAARKIPLESIVVETDCPFLSPIPHRGKPNEPANVAITGRFLADLRGIDESMACKHLIDNSKTLFRI